jgi:hypothetical protein
MNEDFLQFLWNYKLYDTSDLKTNTGEKIEILSVGSRNPDSGPDFRDARIKIGDTVWVGSVEIHAKSSEWYAHGHHDDRAYHNVILHVVVLDDTIVRRSDGELLPTLKIPYSEALVRRYAELSESSSEIPCAEHAGKVDPFKFGFWLSRLATERLERKIAEIGDLLDRTLNDFDEVFHVVLFRSFGFKTNALPFEMLARALPCRLLRKYSGSLFQLEALLFGHAGFLESDGIEDDYCRQLKSEYSFLRHKHGLAPMDKSLWKYSRLRPVNFPTVRIAQIASLLNRHGELWETILSLDDTKEIRSLFDVCASEYWDSHYLFGKTAAKPSPKNIGTATTDSLMINLVAPMLFARAFRHGQDELQERSLHLLELTQPETNRHIAEWNRYNVKPRNALESQALLHLKSEYCTHGKCLNCAVGKEIIQNMSDTEYFKEKTTNVIYP